LPFIYLTNKFIFYLCCDVGKEDENIHVEKDDQAVNRDSNVVSNAKFQEKKL